MTSEDVISIQENGVATTARTGSPIASATFPREYGLDWLRVFAFAVLILYHTGMMFVSWNWHIKNAERSELLEYCMLFANRWRLPLLFLISGAAVYFSLRRRSYARFAGERMQRLFIPVVFGMFVIVPPQIYYERLFHGASLSYAEWYPSVFQFQSYPQGSLSWHHLWYVVYILVFSLIGIPLFRLLKSSGGRTAIARMVDLFERRPWTLYLVNIPNLIAGLSLGPFWPTTHNLIADWANFTGSFLTFLWGFVIASDKRFLDLITRRRREFLYGGIAIAVVFFAVRASGAFSGLSPAPRMVIGELLSAYFGLFWVMTLIGHARHWFKTGGPKLRYANEAVYPFYIVHQTITVMVGYYIIQQPWSVWTKFAVVAIATFGGSWLCFELIRHLAITRVLFGLKPNPRLGREGTHARLEAQA